MEKLRPYASTLWENRINIDHILCFWRDTERENGCGSGGGGEGAESHLRHRKNEEFRVAVFTAESYTEDCLSSQRGNSRSFAIRSPKTGI